MATAPVCHRNRLAGGKGEQKRVLAVNVAVVVASQN
jgi:hypothetical protein